MAKGCDIGGRLLQKTWKQRVQEIKDGKRPDLGDGELIYFERWIERHHPELMNWNDCPDCRGDGFNRSEGSTCEACEGRGIKWIFTL